MAPPPRHPTARVRFAQSQAESSFLGAVAAFMSQPGKKVINLVLMDGSSSLHGYETPLRDGLNSFLENLKTPQPGVKHAVMVVKIQSDFSLLVPFARAENVSPISNFTTADNTLLWMPLWRLIRTFTSIYREISDEQRRDLQVVFGIFTDGDDTDSDRKFFPAKLIDEVKIARAMGFEFMTYGYRHDATRIAGIMGLPTDEKHAITFDKSPEGIQASSQSFTGVSLSFFRVEEFDPPAVNRP